MTTAAEIEEYLISLRSEEYIEQYKYFFKTGKGEYGEGDHFLGVRNPQVRQLVKDYWKTTPLSEAEILIKNKYHECRLCGLLILVEKMLKAKKEEAQKEIYKLYISLADYINNWDLVDLSAIKIVGTWCQAHPEDKTMDEWIRLSDNELWRRRIAMVSTWWLLRRGNFDVVFERAALCLNSKHDLLHKVAGWMLREVYGHGGEIELDEWLAENVKAMPAVMLSYACEKMSPEQKSYWRSKRKEA